MSQPALSERAKLLATVAGLILKVQRHPTLRVGIDGVDGAGKTTLADELVEALRSSGRPIIRATVDGFHNPKAIRYMRGRGSPEGFFHDSYDYTALKDVLLDPLSPGGSGRYRTVVFDHTSDASIDAPEQRAAPGAILIFDGIFLHRPELKDYWDFSIFLDVDFATSIPRGAQRGTMSADPDAPENRRYVEGQKLYLSSCQPARAATVTIDNTDLAAPRVISLSNRGPA